MRKFDTRTEIQVLASIANSTHYNFKYLGLVKQEMFGSPASQEIYQRISKLASEGGKIPSFEALARDPRLSQASRQIVVSARTVRYRSPADFEQGVKTLSTYYKARMLLDTHEKITAALSGDSIEDDFADIEGSLENTLFKMRTEGVEEKIWTGKAGKADLKDLAKRALDNASTGRKFKTGWGEFDENTGGLEPGNVMLITANTGGGKSVAAVTMLTNMYRGQNLNVAYISLEMNENEVMERMISNVTGEEFAPIHLGRLSPVRKAEILEKFDRFNDSSTGSLNLYTPKQDYTIEQLFNQIQSAKLDVAILDYLGLVRPGNYGKNATEEYQLRQMTRFAKRAAERMGCAVILLAQLNDEGQIMYSRGIGHHVHYWLKWFCRDEDIQRGFVVVENGKSRNAEKKDFYLTTNFKSMRMDNVANPPGLEDFKKSQQEARPQGKGVTQHATRRPPKPPTPVGTNIEINLFDSVE
jgi:replicative DNA helicase